MQKSNRVCFFSVLASIIYVTAMSSHPFLLDLLEQIIMSWLDVEKSQIKPWCK